MDGGNRQLVAHVRNPLGIAIYEENIYWSSNWWVSGYRTIERANRFTGLNRQVIYNTSALIYTLRVNHPSKQHTGYYATHTIMSITPHIIC